MTFTKIQRDSWPREEYFHHYFSRLPCTYSGTFRLDVTALRRQGLVPQQLTDGRITF